MGAGEGMHLGAASEEALPSHPSEAEREGAVGHAQELDDLEVRRVLQGVEKGRRRRVVVCYRGDYREARVTTIKQTNTQTKK